MQQTGIQRSLGAVIWTAVAGLLLGAAMVFCGGCASVATNRYLQANNPARVEVAPDGSKILLGLDLFALDQVAEHPVLTTGAALVDAAMIYGVYALGEDEGWWGSGDDAGQRAGDSAGTSGTDEGGSAIAPPGGSATTVVVDSNGGDVTIVVGDGSGNVTEMAE